MRYAAALICSAIVLFVPAWVHSQEPREAGGRVNQLKVLSDKIDDVTMITVPVEVPGDLVSLGFSAQIRARSEKDRVCVTASTDDGRSWREVAVMAGPTQGRTEHVRVNKWAHKTRKALLRFELTGNNTAGVQSFRVDADYRDPMAAKTASPFRVVHRWKEGGRERAHTETIARLPAKYTIQAGSEPEMVSVSYEMGEGR